MDSHNFLSTRQIALLSQAEKNSELVEAARKGYTSLVSDLLAAGASINATGNFGHTALIATAIMGHPATAFFLVEAGADVNLTDSDGDTALIAAAMMGHIAIVSFLLEAGADLNAANIYGDTALIVASRQDRTNIISVLLTAGAHVNAVNHEGETALISASRSYHRNIAYRLMSEMPLQNVVALQSQPVVGNFAHDCEVSLLNVQRDITNILWTFRHTPALSDTNGPIRQVISHHVPEWYAHRANKDISLLSQRLRQLLACRSRAATPFALTASASTRTVSNLNADIPVSPSVRGTFTPTASSTSRRRHRT